MVEKRRRKKARIQTESSSDESDFSADDAVTKSDSELSELSDADEPQSHDTTQTDGVGAEETSPRERLRKAPQSTETEFNQIFLGMVTQQFGEELAALRQSNDFGHASINQLVAGLKQGVDIFHENQRRMLQK